MFHIHKDPKCIICATIIYSSNYKFTITTQLHHVETKPEVIVDLVHNGPPPHLMAVMKAPNVQHHAVGAVISAFEPMAHLKLQAWLLIPNS